MDKKNFTESFISNLKATGKRYVVADTKYPYLQCRVTETGSKAYYFYRKYNKELIKIKIDDVGAMTAEEARVIAHKYNNDLLAGKDPRSTKKDDSRITLLRVFDDLAYLSNWQPQTMHDYIYAINTTFSDWQTKDIREINRDMIENRYKKLSENSVSLTNLHFRFLRHLLNFAMEKYSTNGVPFIPSNPCNRLKVLKIWKKLPPRDDIIPVDKLPEFFKATEVEEADTYQTKQTKIQCRILLFTGCRDQEIASLRRRDVNLDKCFITIERTKNGRKHEVPFGDYLKEIFEYLCKGKEADDFLFPSKNHEGHLKDPSRAIKKIKDSMSFKFYLHICRHTFQTYAVKLNIQPYIIKQLVNHISGTSGDVTFDYIGQDEETLREAILKIESFILKNGNQKYNENEGQLSGSN